MKYIIYENIVKILTVMFINMIFIFINGYQNFKLETISKLDYLLFAAFAIFFALAISAFFKKLFKFKFFTIAITTIVNTTIVVVSSIFGMGIYLLLVSDNTTLTQIFIVFGSLTILLIFAISTLFYINKKVAEIKA